MTFGFIRENQDENNIIFYSGGLNNWQVWSKPNDARFVRILTIGAGGGAGAGTSGTAGTNRNGGGGGSSGLVTVVTYPAIFLPDTLFVSVGVGGPGASVSGGTGTPGTVSVVAVYPTLNVTGNYLCAANGGRPGTGFDVVSPESAMPNSQIPLVGGNRKNVQGSRTGARGGYSTNSYVPGTYTYGTSQEGTLTGGAGGGGCATTTAYKGANIVVQMGSVAFLGNVFGGQIAGTEGNSGSWNWTYMMGTGGAGGAASDSGTGGKGGNGGYGCGGGGGGAGTTFGAGGDGGDGLVVISYW